MPARWKSLVWLAIVLPLLCLIYLFGMQNALVFDDFIVADGSVFADYGFADYGYLQSIKPRLLSYSTFTWVRDVFGEALWKQRIVNLAIHIAVVLALWGLYREILKYIAHAQDDLGGGITTEFASFRESPALGLAIGFFALNPVAIYAVAYLIQRSILLATLFVVLALLAFMRGLADRRIGYFALALLCYLLAVASKEHAVMAPFVAALLYILVARPSVKTMAVWLAVGMALVVGVGAVLVAYYGEIIGQPFDQYSRIYLAQLAALGPDVEKHAFALSIINQAYFFFKYGLFWLLPYTGWMSIDMRPPFPVSLATFPQVLGGVGYLALVVSGLVMLIKYRDWRALVGLSVLMPAILYVTEFSTVWVQDPFVLYRSYLWAIGLPGLVFFMFHGLPSKVLLIVGLALAGLFAWGGIDRVYSMSTPERAWTDAIAKLPEDERAVGRWFPYLNRGNEYLDKGRERTAVQDFMASSKLGDGGFGAYNIGAMLYSEGKYEKSLAMLDQAASQGFSLPSLNYQKGIAYLARRDFASALREFSSALDKAPPMAERLEILVMRARANLGMGHIDVAIQDLATVLGTMPEHKKARLSMGMAYVKNQQYQLAQDVFSKLMAGDEHAPLYYGRAMANHGLKHKQAALDDINKAIELSPQEPEFKLWRDKIVAMP